MSMKWFALFAFVYIQAIFLGSTFENSNTAATWGPGGGTMGREKSPIAVLEDAVQGKALFQEQPLLGGAIVIPIPNTAVIGAVYDVLTLQFDFLQYDKTGKIFYMVVLFPLVIAGILSLLLMFFGMIFGNITWG